jgi:hypothetical protein
MKINKNTYLGGESMIYYSNKVIKLSGLSKIKKRIHKIRRLYDSSGWQNSHVIDRLWESAFPIIKKNYFRKLKIERIYERE